MNKPVIAFDFDDTLLYTTRGFVDWYNATYKTFIRYEDITADMATFLGIPREAELSLWALFFSSDFFKALKPTPGVIDVLHTLHANYELVLITNREVEFKDSLFVWVNAYAPALFSHIVFARDFPEGKKPKGEICRDMRALCLIDDEPSNLVSAQEHGVQPIIFDAPWNQKEIIGNRIKTFTELPALISSL
jgi:5'(3')-deoxyribonucleotidase